MHVVQVLNHKKMVNSIKSFRKINQGKNDSMWLGFVDLGVDEMEKPDHIVRNGGAFQATTVSRIQVWLNYRE